MSEHKPSEHEFIHKTISFVNPREVLYTNPVFIPTLAVFGIAVLFTIWPEILEHSPIGFEQRGIIHHFWHYGLLLFGAMVALYGMFSTHRHRFSIELAGVISIAVAVGINVSAQVSVLISEGPEVMSEVGGLGLAFRVAMFFHFSLRAYMLIRKPKLDVFFTISNGDPSSGGLR